jgi:hypothetical protein
LPEVQVAKKVIVKTVMGSGFILIKLHMKENGLVQKKMAKGSKRGQMVISMKENLKIVSGVE